MPVGCGVAEGLVPGVASGVAPGVAVGIGAGVGSGVDRGVGLGVGLGMAKGLIVSREGDSAKLPKVAIPMPTRHRNKKSGFISKSPFVYPEAQSAPWAQPVPSLTFATTSPFSRDSLPWLRLKIFDWLPFSSCQSIAHPKTVGLLKNQIPASYLVTVVEGSDVNS